MGGDPLWSKTMPLDKLGFQTASVSLDSLIVDAAGNVVPAGRLNGGLHIDDALITSFNPDINAYAVKLEGSSGNHLFSKTFGNLGGTTDYGVVRVGADSTGTLFGEGAAAALLTNDPDGSLEPLKTYEQQVLAGKQNCPECILTAGLLRACVPAENQRLWQFMTAFGDEPIWRDIEAKDKYPEVVGAALASALVEACENIPIG